MGGYSRGLNGVIRGYYRGTLGVLRGYLRATEGVLEGSSTTGCNRHSRGNQWDARRSTGRGILRRFPRGSDGVPRGTGSARGSLGVFMQEYRGVLYGYSWAFSIKSDATTTGTQEATNRCLTVSYEVYSEGY
jgi:hypothetical protein